jgi:hypothetical protein
MRTSFRHQSEAQPPNGPLTAAASPDTPSYMASQAVRPPRVAQFDSVWAWNDRRGPNAGHNTRLRIWGQQFESLRAPHFSFEIKYSRAPSNQQQSVRRTGRVCVAFFVWVWGAVGPGVAKRMCVRWEQQSALNRPSLQKERRA